MSSCVVVVVDNLHHFIYINIIFFGNQSERIIGVMHESTLYHRVLFIYISFFFFACITLLIYLQQHSSVEPNVSVKEKCGLGGCLASTRSSAAEDCLSCLGAPHRHQHLNTCFLREEMGSFSITHKDKV